MVRDYKGLKWEENVRGILEREAWVDFMNRGKSNDINQRKGENGASGFNEECILERNE